MEEKGISVREVEKWLDVDAYLTEHQHWVPCRLHCQFLLHRMFIHAVAMGQKEYDHAIHHGRWEPSVEQDLEVEPSAIELIYASSTREEIAEIYHDMYQLQQSPGKMSCVEEREEHLCQELLDSLKECLW